MNTVFPVFLAPPRISAPSPLHETIILQQQYISRKNPLKYNVKQIFLIKFLWKWHVLQQNMLCFYVLLYLFIKDLSNSDVLIENIHQGGANCKLEIVMFHFDFKSARGAYYKKYGSCNAKDNINMFIFLHLKYFKKFYVFNVSKKL